jgi:hypothetical protein
VTVNNKDENSYDFLLVSVQDFGLCSQGRGADWGIGEGKWKLRDLKLAGGGGGCSIWIVMVCN